MRIATLLLLVPVWLLLLGAAAAQTPVLDIKDNGATLAQVNTDAGFVVEGTFGAGVIPATGAGLRLMWYPRRAAFRAGRVTSTQWNDANIGQYSVAMGQNTTASGNRSMAMGQNTTASGDRSVALGNGTTASGSSSTALGFNTEASGQASTAMGQGTTASLDQATAMGTGTTAAGASATAMGDGTTAQARASLVIGRYNTIAGNPSTWIDTDPLFVAGNGSSTSAPADALTLLKNGDLTIAGTLTESSDRRLKEDINPLKDVLGGLRAIQPVSFRFRAGTHRSRARQLGLLAQEVERVFPELVMRDGSGYLSVSYAKLSAVLLQAVKEQQTEIETLQRVIAAQQQRLAQLETKQGTMQKRLAQLEDALRSAAVSTSTQR